MYLPTSGYRLDLNVCNVGLIMQQLTNKIRYQKLNGKVEDILHNVKRASMRYNIIVTNDSVNTLVTGPSCSAVVIVAKLHWESTSLVAAVDGIVAHDEGVGNMLAGHWSRNLCV